MINFGIVIMIIPFANFAVMFSKSILFSNLTVLTHLPFLIAEDMSSASSSYSNSSMYDLKVVSIVMSLSPASIKTSSFSTPGTAALI